VKKTQKKIQGFVAISVLIAFISSPFLVQNLGLSMIFAMDASARMLSAFFVLGIAPVIRVFDHHSISRIELARAFKGLFSLVENQVPLSKDVKHILIGIFTVSAMAGAMNVLEVPILIKNVKASSAEISIILGLFAFSFFLGSYGSRKIRLSQHSRELHYGAAAILGWSTAIFLKSDNFVTCSLAMVAFGLANAGFNQVYTFKFQQLTNLHETASASAAAALSQRAGLFFTSSLMWIPISQDVFINFCIGFCLTMPIFFIFKICSSQKKVIINSLFASLLFISMGLIPVAKANAEERKLRILSEGIPQKIDPVETRLISWGTIFNQVFDALYEYTENNALRPLLAKNHVISADGKRVKIFIDSEATFSDGTPLTAEIVAKSLWRSTSMLGESARWAFGEVAGFDEFINGGPPEKFGIQPVSSNEISIVLQRPFPYILQVLTAPNFLITKPDKDGDLIGTGAYIVHSIAKEEAVLAYRSDLIKSPNSPSALIFTAVSSGKDRREYFVKKDTDISVVTQQFGDAPAGFRTENYKFLRAMFILMNSKSQRFSGAKERCEFASSFEGAIKKSSYRWDRVFNGFPFAWNFFPELNSRNKQTSKIKAMKSTTLLYADSLSAHFNEQANAAVARDLKIHGHQVTFKSTDLNQLSQAMASGKFEAIMIGYVPDYLDPDAIIFPLLRTGQLYNLSRYTNPSVDNLIGLARQMSDSSSRNIVYGSLFEIIGKECPVHFLGSEEGRYVISSNWKLPGLSGLGFYNLKLKNARFQGE
jgi:ABC-type transport system substrate-binding protein